MQPLQAPHWDQHQVLTFPSTSSALEAIKVSSCASAKSVPILTYSGVSKIIANVNTNYKNALKEMQTTHSSICSKKSTTPPNTTKWFTTLSNKKSTNSINSKTSSTKKYSKKSIKIFSSKSKKNSWKSQKDKPNPLL